MSGITHKESLRGHERIKRRRVDPVPSADAEEVSTAATTAEASPDDRKMARTETAPAPAPVPAKDKSSHHSSSSEDDDEDDDLEAIQREQERLVKLREQREKRAHGDASASAAPDHAAGASGGGAQAYDSDVLFRRRDWRGKPQTEAQKRANQWSAVTNSTQSSTAYKQSMRQFFK